jgi:hypothetical protein
VSFDDDITRYLREARAEPPTEQRCQHCGGELAPEVSLRGASRCLACGKGTMRVCGNELDCGAPCARRRGHEADSPCHCLLDAHGHPSPLACCADLPCGCLCFLGYGHEPPCVCDEHPAGAA